jgi:hypothetical protein
VRKKSFKNQHGFRTAVWPAVAFEEKSEKSGDAAWAEVGHAALLSEAKL